MHRPLSKIILATVFILPSLVIAKDDDPYSSSYISKKTAKGELSWFFGDDGSGARFSTPKNRLAASMKRNASSLSSFVESSFKAGRDFLVGDYKAKGRDIVLDKDIPALDFVAADFFKRQGADVKNPNAKGLLSMFSKQGKKVDAKIHIQRTPDGDAEMKGSLGDELFKDLYGEVRDPEQANPYITTNKEAADKKIAELGQITSVSYSSTNQGGNLNYIVYDSTKPIRLAHQDQIILVMADRRALLYNDIASIPAAEIQAAKEIHVSLENFHAVDSVLTGEELPKETVDWKSRLVDMYKSSKSGKIALDDASDETKEILNLLDPSASCTYA